MRSLDSVPFRFNRELSQQLWTFGLRFRTLNRVRDDLRGEAERASRRFISAGQD
jgi:hypothetical protein